MENIYAELARILDEGDDVAVATIIDVKGSVPREVGAKMIIHPLGRHVGTVGGGCGEADVIRAALDVIQTGEPATVRVDLTEDISMQALGVCGGIMDVFVERVAAKDEDGKARAVVPTIASAALRHAVRTREPVALATVVGGPSAGREAVVWLDKPAAGRAGPGRPRSRRSSPTRKRSLRGRQHKLLKYRRPTSALRLRRSPAPRAGTADRRRRAHRRAAGADGEHVRLRGHRAR